MLFHVYVYRNSNWLQLKVAVNNNSIIYSSINKIIVCRRFEQSFYCHHHSPYMANLVFQLHILFLNQWQKQTHEGKLFLHI